MCKTAWKCAFALALCLADGADAGASVQIGDQLKFYDGIGTAGGVFHIDILRTAGVPDFDSFCVEIGQDVNGTSLYGVENISLANDSSGKVLTPYVAWLYTRYLDRNTNGFLASFNPTFSSDMNALQLAIWLGMGYTVPEVQAWAGLGWYANYSLVLNSKPWASQFAADGTWSGVGDIRILILRVISPNGVYTDYAQDQLDRQPPGTPEPASLLVWGLLAGSVAGVCRSRRQRAD